MISTRVKTSLSRLHPRGLIREADMKKSDESLRQAQEDMERRKRLLAFGKIRVDPEPTAKSPIKQKDQERGAGHSKEAS